MNDVLAAIVKHKRAEVEAARARTPVEALREQCRDAPGPRDFYAAVARPANRPNLIAEIKRRSPSRGEILPGLNVTNAAREYQAGGATALSVLTDERYFGGSVADFQAARAAVDLPVLRKEFIIDEYQLYESRCIGADAALLIAECLPPDTLTGLAELALGLDLCVLIEVHSRETLAPLLPWFEQHAARRILLGINNRDLRRQQTDLETFCKVAANAPQSIPLVAESGIVTHADAMRMHREGACAMLVGESLLTQPDLTAAVRALLAP